MQELLPLFQHPSHYLGNELNSIHKDLDKVSLRWCLAFPDLYEIGMSHLGQKILYHILNNHPKIWAERVFAPHPEVAKILRQFRTPLCSLESDTPLSCMDIIGFSITHELSYTTILFILDLAGIPLYSKERNNEYPLIIGGGGATYNPEPIAPFLDCFVIGEGEELSLELSHYLLKAKETSLPKQEILVNLSKLDGVYVPDTFRTTDNNRFVVPIEPRNSFISKRTVKDLDQVDYPTEQILPYGKPVHDRLTIEIARGCTRGCRFCQAGMTYRPVRERSLNQLYHLIQKGLKDTGYEEFSFLSLSTGDYSALDELFANSYIHCRQEQVAISLPSLRVGSLNPSLYKLLSDLRRTGATFAPEAGTERLRNVVNKGIRESDLLEDIKTLFSLGWHRIKLYFMIGLPTETEEDIHGIYELCKNILKTGKPRSSKAIITAHIAPFVPKPQTPFQWVAQSPTQEILEKLTTLQRLFRSDKRLNLRWHKPEMSYLEGILSRGDRALAPCIKAAYEEGEILTSWQEHCHLSKWEQAFESADINPDNYLGQREIERLLPWDHISAKVSKDFLQKEYQRALAEKTTPDCRYNPCQNCGVCQEQNKGDSHHRPEGLRPRVINPKVFRNKHLQELEDHPWQDLHQKKASYRLWYSKTGPTRHLSQLELQNFFERFFRRAMIPLTFSQGFHSNPLISFGRALPVGVSSKKEWCLFTTRLDLPEQEILKMLQSTSSLPGIQSLGVDRIDPFTKPELSTKEIFKITFFVSRHQAQQYHQQWLDLMDRQEFVFQKKTKKGHKMVNLRDYILSVDKVSDQEARITFNWQEGYLNPLMIVYAVNAGIDPRSFELCKTDQL